jgi:hypothetical protein
MYDHKSLLDRRREGQEFSLADINRALRDAGDLEPFSEAREWIKRYRKKRLELGKQEAQAWWENIKMDMKKRRGQDGLDTLITNMRQQNEIRQLGFSTRC